MEQETNCTENMNNQQRETVKEIYIISEGEQWWKHLADSYGSVKTHSSTVFSRLGDHISKRAGPSLGGTRGPNAL